MERTCKKCNETKDLEDFVKKNDRPLGRSYECASCNSLRRRGDKSAQTDSARNSRYKWAFGITLDDYEAMFKEQDGCCLGCGNHQSTFSKRLAVDHCHTTGAIRGLLCMSCNIGLGNLKDNIDTLKNLIKYLEK